MKKIFFLLAAIAPFSAINMKGTAQTSSKSTVTSGDSTSYWKAAVEADPENLSKHEKFIKEIGLKSEELVPLYNSWIKKYPKSEIIPLAIGSAFYSRESPEAKPYLLKVVALNPKQAKVWQMLSVDADRWGDNEASRKYMGNAAAADPADPSYSFYYAMDFEHTDPAQWRAKLYELAKKFPASERGAQGLYWLATRSTDAAEKLRVYELLRASYAPSKFNWSSSGMSALYDLYLQSVPEKAIELARSMGPEDGWGLKDTLAQKTIAVHSLVAEKKYSEAMTLVNTIKTPRYSGVTEMIALLKSEVRDGAGNTIAAYDSLVALYSKTPGDNVYTAIEKYGKKLNKTGAQMEADIWKVRDAATKPAPDFNLGLYSSSGTAKLDDFRGKVILLTFWFPGCGPCRGEFPHFQEVIDKYKGKDVVYLGINVSPDQDSYVVPFMKGTGYTFIPLKGTSEWAEKVYKVRGEPTNFLIDKQGKIVYTNFRTDANNHRELELMINSLLNKS